MDDSSINSQTACVRNPIQLGADAVAGKRLDNFQTQIEVLRRREHGWTRAPVGGDHTDRRLERAV
jgi:hypothetical protein